MSLPRSLRSLYRRYFPSKPGRVLGVEIANICNLHCAYCLRDEDMLYGKAQFLDPSRLFGLLDAMPETLKPLSLALTGGEPLLHPEFGVIVRGLHDRKVRFKVVTNGWHFERVRDSLAAVRDSLIAVAFSLDGATREAHDTHRGAGSFDRVMKALAACERWDLPFQFNIVLRQDTCHQMETLAILGARLGARAVNFGAMLPTDVSVHQKWGLSRSQEMEARREARSLSSVLRIPIKISFGLYDEAPGAHCPPLQGRSLTLDYRGQLRLCGNLSSFRGGKNEGDVPQNAHALSLADGWIQIGEIGARALAHRDAGLARLAAQGNRPDPIQGSPCLACLNHFGKLNEDVRTEIISRWTEDPSL